MLPVLDEAAAIPEILAAMPRGYRPIVVDNGSSDGSGDVARAHGAVVVTEAERGFGSACWSGLLTSKPSDGVVCFMDADGSLDPRDLPRVAGPVLDGHFDLTLGARRPTTRAAWPAHARLANAVLAWELRRRTGLAFSDLGPMRAARRDELVALEIRDRRFGWPLEMVLRAAAAGWRLDEVEVAYRSRTGRSKVTGTAVGTLRTVADMARALR